MVVEDQQRGYKKQIEGNAGEDPKAEMSACHASIDFSYDRMEQNCDFANASVIVEDHLFDREFMDLTEGK